MFGDYRDDPKWKLWTRLNQAVANAQIQTDKSWGNYQRATVREDWKRADYWFNQWRFYSNRVTYYGREANRVRAALGFINPETKQPYRMLPRYWRMKRHG